MSKSKMIDRLVQRYAGCEKLPEGPMRDNCEKKSEEGEKSKKEAAPLESEMSFIRRVTDRVGVPPNRIKPGKASELIGSTILAKRDNVYVVGTGYPDVDEDGNETYPRSAIRIITL
jgi:hypothetical protein